MALGLVARAEFTRLEVELRAHNSATPTLVPFLSPDKSERCTELDCVRDLLPAGVAEDAARRAIDVGIGADRVLVNAGHLEEAEYLRALATSLGAAFETLEDVSREHCPLIDERLIEAVAAGILPLSRGNDVILVVAPRGFAVRRIIALIESNPDLAQRFRFTTEGHLRRFVFHHAGGAIGHRAAHSLHENWPAFSAAAPRSRASFVSVIVLGAIATGAFFLGPGPVLLVFSIALALVFLAWMVLRIAGAMVGRPQRPARARLADHELPVYSIIAPLYREAAAAQGLIAALGSLDYPGIMAQTPQAAV